MPHFNVMFTYQGTTKVILLGSTQDANYATIVLEAARSRLLQAQVRGDLELVRHNGERQTLLRESLSSPSHSLTAALAKAEMSPS